MISLKKVTFGFILTAVLLITIESCTYKDLVPGESSTEYIITTDSLTDYLNWPLRGSISRPDIGEHRTIYVNIPEEADRLTGSYPQGTIIMKESRNLNDLSDIMLYQVMVKRGGGFNPIGNGWEWIITDDLNDLTSRGGNESTLPNGATCVSCHNGQNDLVFNVYVP